MTVLCQVNDESFLTKPTDIRFMGKLRDKMIQKPWDYLTDVEFIRRVTLQGKAWYGCLFNGHDLMETGRQRECWRAQTMVAVDIDKCPIPPREMCKFYADLGYLPWMAYETFSSREVEGQYSYRIVWKVEIDHSIKYEEWAAVIKGLSQLTEYGDKHAMDCTRMWQGSWHGTAWLVPYLSPYTYEELAGRLGLTTS